MNSFGDVAAPSNGGIAARSASPSRLPDYSCRKVQAALEHLSSIDLIELCNEAKVEHCRATRDLRSCRRYVRSMLNSCGHASLCEECSQRCDICPICRIPIPKNVNRLRLRLYYECIEAGLISKRCDDEFQEKESGDNQLTADVRRLYSFFDVAMENNLVSLICHYVTDVCMDESAVSSDPVVAFLLDEVVVKDWCKRRFKNIVAELQRIYNLTEREMKESLSQLLKCSVNLAGISSVLEVLESSIKGSLSAQLNDIHRLQESILKTKQHAEMMGWCIKHQFLVNVTSRHASFTSWRSLVRERKSAAIKRAWPDLINHPAESTIKTDSTLFIEEAISNLDHEQAYAHEIDDEFEIASLQKDEGTLYFRSKIEGMAGCYPFESPISAVDILFLRGSSDLVVAKQAIFLYYLFDRYWTMPDDKWRNIVDDFAASFGITRHSLLESLTFYLLDDHTDDALKEACRLLPEISGPTIHPKVAQVLLERENPDAALMVLRWSGRDCGSHFVSLGEAVTAVRVRVECGLLTEAFMYQRTLTEKVNKRKSRPELPENAPEKMIVDEQNWVEALVTEICCLCIRRRLVDRMIELPWNSNEEKHLHKCLFDFATDDPSSTIGSLLVVFYLQRYRYMEAYQVDCKLQSVEEDFISKASVSEEVIFKMKSASHWRVGLVEKSLELLPEIQQQQVKNGNLPEISLATDEEINVPLKSNLPVSQEPNLSSLLVPSSINPSFVRSDNSLPNSLTPFKLETPSRLGGSIKFPLPEKGQNGQSGFNRMFKFDEFSTPIFNKSASRVRLNSQLQHNRFTKISPEKESSPNSGEIPAINALTPPNINYGGIFKDFPQDSITNVSGKRMLLDRGDRSWNASPLDDSMDISWSHEEKLFSVDNGGLRWRSDESSDDEEQQNLNRFTGGRKIRRSRFSRR